MKVSVTRTRIEKLPENKVTSHLHFMPRSRRNIENLKFHPDGLFSRRIFGVFDKCECGAVIGEGFCEEDDVRVIGRKNMPHFYVDLTIEVAVPLADFDKTPDADGVKELLAYRAFLYKGIVRPFDDLFEDSSIDKDKILIGVDALRAIEVEESWIEENTVDWLSIPHICYRPIVNNNGDPFITTINSMYSDVIAAINIANGLHEEAKGKPAHLLSQYRVIANIHSNIIDQLFKQLHEDKHSIMKSEVISHPITGAARAVLINRHDLHEDVLLVGDTFVETLWPSLYKQYEGDIIQINQHLVRENCVVLINRPPSISHMSVMAMKPRIASMYPFGKTEGTNGALNHNYKRVIEDRDKIGTFFDKEGDVERFGQGEDDGIDTLGLRCIGMNPIGFDGLAADTDGDVLLVIAIYSDKARNEALGILPSKSYMNYPNGEIRNHIIEDFMFV